MAVTSEQLEVAMGGDFKALCREVAKAIDEAKAGHIIADSEEGVRDAVGAFRQRLYQKALDIRQHNEEGAFSPCAPGEQPFSTQQGQPQDHAHDCKRAVGDHPRGVLEQAKRKRRAGR